MIEFSAIEKQPMSDNVCKGYLTGNANQNYRNFVCVDAELNNKVKSGVFEIFLRFLMFNHIAFTWIIIIICIQKVKSVLGINRFPSSPLFCQGPAGYFGLVGIGMEQGTGGNEGKYHRACVRNLEQVLSRDWSPKFATLYSCNNITTTLIQISRLFYFGFFSKTKIRWWSY